MLDGLLVVGHRSDVPTYLNRNVVKRFLQAFPELCRRGTLVLVHRDELVQQASMIA